MRDLFVPTFTGRRVPLENPQPLDIDLLDIAHHLATINRFTGACKEPYSVAQHSIFVSQLLQPISPRLGLLGLMHDAHEAYLNDMPRPVKFFHFGQNLPLPTDRDDIERTFDRVIRARYGIADPSQEEREQVANFDDIALSTEWCDLLHENVGACPIIAPAVIATTTPWPWRRAKEEFLVTFWGLMRAAGVQLPLNPRVTD